MNEVLLDDEQVEALRVLVEASRAVSREDREPFSYKFVVGERRAIVEHSGLPEQMALILFSDIEVLEKAGLVHVSREAKSYGSLFVMPAGFRYYETKGAMTSHLESRRLAIISKNANIPLSSNPASADVTRADSGAGDSAQERPPDTLWAAVLRHIWKTSPKVRVLVLISIALFAAFLAIWSTLPDAAKERLLGIEKPSVDTRVTTQTDTKAVVRPAPDHDRSIAGGLADSVAKADHLEGWLGERHHPSADPELIGLVLENEGANVELVLHLGPEIASQFAKVQPSGDRTYSFALVDPDGPIHVDLDARVSNGTDFFFGAEGSATAILRGTFRVLGCRQTGTGWFSCEIQAVPLRR